MDKFWYCYLTGILVIVLSNNCFADDQCRHRCASNKTCNFRKIGNNCYYLFKDIVRNWTDSTEFCAIQGLSMVIIIKEMFQNTSLITDFFIDIPNTFTGELNGPQAWLGGRANDHDDWKFVNGDEVKRPSWGLSADIASGTFEKCGALKGDGNYFDFRLSECYHKSSYLCRNKNCLESENCLKFIHEKKTWFKARSHCIDLGGDLFYLNRNETLISPLLTNNPVSQTIKELSGQVYIGFRRRQWKWNDDTEIHYTNWRENEPSSYHEKCLMLYGNDGSWNDESCSSLKMTFCQEAAPVVSHTSNTTEYYSQHTTSFQPLAARSTTTKPSTTAYTTAFTTTIKPWYFTQDMLIILASLLGLFFLTTVALIIVIICMKHKCLKKYDVDDTVIVDNDYYESSAEPRHRSPVTASTPRYTNPPESTVEYSYDASLATQSNGSIHQTAEKPVIKPKPIIGPHGDVNSTVEKPARLPIKPTTNGQYVNTS